MLWKRERTWKTLRKSYGLMKKLNAGYRTMWIQCAYSECYVAYRLLKAGYDVEFHTIPGCDLSLRLNDTSDNPRIIKIEVKNSEDNKEKDRDGHGFASWVISKPQVEKEKFNLCILLRDSLKFDVPDAVYVFARREIANTKTVNVNGYQKYYLWNSEFFEEISKKYKPMREAANPLVQSLRKTPERFEKRWKKMLDGEVLTLLSELTY